MTRQPNSNQERPRRPLSVWELPKLATLVHTYRRSSAKTAKIRPHFPAILAFVYRNRFTIASQIQRRFPKYVPSDRTARRHLAEMESLGLLGVQPVTGVSPLMPKPYFVTRTGLKRLRRAYQRRGREWQPYLSDRKRTSGQSFPHVWHELATTEFLLSVWEVANHGPEVELLAVERRSLVRHPGFRLADYGRKRFLTPDALFLFRTNAGGMMLCLVEIDTGTESEEKLQTKLQAYAQWASSSAARNYLLDCYGRYGAEQPRPVFRLLIITCGWAGIDRQTRLRTLCRLTAHQPDPFRKRVWLTSSESLSENHLPNRILQMPIWIRGSDLSPSRRCPSGHKSFPRYPLFH